MVSKSPMKVKEFKENIQIQKLPFGKLVYSYTDKQNNTGFSKNSRLLMMDTISGMIGYYNQAEIPTIPIQNYQNLKKKPMKKKAPISSMSYLKVKDKPTIQIKVKEVDFKGKKTDEKWSFNFKSSKIAEDWIRQMDEAKRFIVQRPPIGQSMPPTFINNSYSQPMSTMTVVKNPPIYPNQLLTSSAINKNLNESQKLPIDRDQHLGSQLIYQTTQYNDPLLIRSNYRQPINQDNVINSRISGTRSPQIGSSSVRIGGSKIDPNPIGTSHISNTNYNPNPIGTSHISNTKYNPQASVINQNSSYNPGTSGIGISATIPATSSVKPNPNLNLSSSKFSPVPNYSRHSQTPIQPPISIAESRGDPKRNISIEQSRTQRPPVYESGNGRDWNLEFLNSDNPIQTLMDFRDKAEQLARGIIDEQGIDSNRRKYSPWRSDRHDIYIVGSFIIYIAFLSQEQTQYKQLKNEFRNYNYILNATQNTQAIKVPLAIFVDYKGVAALVKAKIPKSEEISFNSIYHQLDELEKATKIDKEILKTNCVFHKLTVAKKTYIFVDQLVDYIPFDIQAAEQSSQFRKQFVQTLNEVLPGGHYSGKRSDYKNKGFVQLDEAAKRMRQYGTEVATMIQNLDITILNSTDLTKQFHLNGVSIRSLGLYAGQCDNPIIKKYFVSEIASRVCKKIIKSQLQKEMKKMKAQKYQLSDLEPMNAVLLDEAFYVLNDIVSQNDRTDRIWRIVIQQAKRKFNITFSKEDLSVGYFLGALFQKSNLKLNYQYLSKDKNYFRAPNCLRRDFVTGFVADIDSYDITFSEQYRKLNQILNSDANEEGFSDLVDLLKLRSAGLPEYCYVYDIDSRIKWYMGNFISYNSQQYQKVGIYSSIGQQPPTLNSIKQSLLAMKWLKKNPQDQNGNIIFEVATDLITFWGGQYHPLLSELYDFVMGNHIINGNYQSALSLAKSSLSNCIKVSGANSLIAGQKYYQLGQVFFKMGKKEDALTNYQITRQILQANKKTNIDDYGYIALKLAMLNLNFSKNSQAASKALEALRIFESHPVKQQSMLETYEVLARAYQISNQKAELLNLSSLCSKKLPTITNPRVYERMLKVVLYPHMIGLNQSVAKDLLMIYQQIKKSASQSQATQFLKTQTSEHSGLQFANKLQKIQRILGDIHNKNLITKYKGLSMSNQGQGEEFLAYLQAIGTVLGDNFVMGVLIEASE